MLPARDVPEQVLSALILIQILLILGIYQSNLITYIYLKVDLNKLRLLIW